MTFSKEHQINMRWLDALSKENAAFPLSFSQGILNLFG